MRIKSQRKNTFLTLGVFAATAVILAGAWMVLAVVRNLPDPDELFTRRVVQSTKIYDRTGEVLLYDIHGEERRTVIPYTEIPTNVKNATVAVEDGNFWNHGGIDFRGIARALLFDILHRDTSQGGSTITQQLVKNSLVGTERTLKRKIKEALLAVMLESRNTKEKILGMYLNQIPYGQGAYGIEAAAETYFGKRARDLTLAEATILAALPRAPSYYSPYGQHKPELIARQRLVLARMAEMGYLNQDDVRRTENEPLHFMPASHNILAPHFVMYVRDYLTERYGEDEVENGGLKVITTLDWGLQGEAEKLVAEGAQKNEQLIGAKNMALVAVNPKNGDILAMVGSRNYFDVANDGNFNVATASRQPGSAFKPFVYATAFKEGYAPDTVLFDVPTEFNPQCGPNGLPRPGTNEDPKNCYHPQDYDEKFRGPVSLRQALAQSLNVPSVKLLYLAGVNQSIDTAETLGITTLHDRSRFGLSLVLGGAEVKLLEMTSAYGVLANDGVRNPSRAILRVEGPDGTIYEEAKDQPQLVLDPDVVRTVNNILSDNDARVPVFQPHSSLYFPDRQVAVKTGTTQDYRDAWTIGYTPSIAVGAWAGNNDNTAMQQKSSGVLAAAPTWHAFMVFALDQMPPESFAPSAPAETTKPILKGLWQGDTVVAIDRISGKLATNYTPPETTEYAAYGKPHDPLYWINRDDPAGLPLKNPGDDPQYPNWEASFEEWLTNSGFRPRDPSTIPKDYDSIHTPEHTPKIEVLKKSESNDAYVIEVNANSTYALTQIVFLQGGKTIRVESFSSNTFPKSMVIPKNDFDPSTPQIEVRAYDAVGNVGRAALTLP